VKAFARVGGRPEGSREAVSSAKAPSAQAADCTVHHADDGGQGEVGSGGLQQL
jgi:hypothetical protein